MAWKQVASGKFTFKYMLHGDKLMAEVSYPTTGWVAVGFNPTKKMKDANFIIGYADGAKSVVDDQFGDGAVSHKPDTLLGGTYNLSETKASEKDGITTIAFTMPLNSGDPRDGVIEKGKPTALIFGAGKRDDLTSKHSDIAKTTVTF
jgi:hypothetical protein